MGSKSGKSGVEAAGARSHPPGDGAIRSDGGAGWGREAVLAVVCALVIGIYARSADTGMLEYWGSSARESYYNLLVEGFRAGQLNVKREAPPELAGLANSGAGIGQVGVTNHLSDSAWIKAHHLHDLSYYRGKLYLYFGATPALVLFWPYVLLTGHYLYHRQAVVIFFSVSFLISAGLLRALWRRYFWQVSVWWVAAGALALGLADFTPAILRQADVYEVAISCGQALAMAALAAIWLALHRPQLAGRWLTLASLAYGLAIGARPSLAPGAIMLLVPVAYAWRGKLREPVSMTASLRRAAQPQKSSGEPCRPAIVGKGEVANLNQDLARTSGGFQLPSLWRLALAAAGPISMICGGIMLYNYLRFQNPLDFGQEYQVPVSLHHQFGLGYCLSNLRTCFLTPEHWHWRFPYVELQVEDHPFGVFSNVPLVWLGLALPFGWRGWQAAGWNGLTGFILAVGLLLGGCAIPLLLHDSMCLRYGVEYAHSLVLLSVIGILAMERNLAGSSFWKYAGRGCCGLLLAGSVGFNILANFAVRAYSQSDMAFELIDQGHLDQARVHFEAVQEAQPSNPLPQYNIGCILLQQDKPGEALPHFQKALEISPRFAAGHYNLGTALIRTGRRDEAIEQFRRALILSPTNAEFRVNLGIALAQKGLTQEAIIEYRKALERAPDYALAHGKLAAALLAIGRADEGIVEYRRSLQLAPDNVEEISQLGLLLAQKGEADESIAWFQKAVRLQSDHAGLRNNLGAALAQEGRLDEAMSEFEEALKLQSANPDTHRNLGVVLAQKGRLDEAIAQFRSSLELRPRDATTHSYLAEALNKAGRHEEAQTEYKEAEADSAKQGVPR